LKKKFDKTKEIATYKRRSKEKPKLSEHALIMQSMPDNKNNKFKLEVRAIENTKQREFFSTMMLHKVDAKSIVINSLPKVEDLERIQSPTRRRSPFLSALSKCRETTTVRFTKVKERETKVEFVTELELGTGVKKRAVQESLEKHLAVHADVAIYFLNLLGRDKVTESEGKVMGEQLMLKIKHREKERSKEEVVKAFIEDNKALKELVEKEEFFGGLLCAVVWNRLRRDASKEGVAGSVEEEEGRLIGSKLAMTMATTLTTKHAVEEWSLQFPEVQEAMDENIWIRPMLENITIKLMERVAWGIQMRVFIGAVTSMTDMATDIYVTRNFLIDGEYEYFHASLASLIASVGLQLICVILQNRGVSWRRVLQESSSVIIGFKPAVDAYRVATSQKQMKGQVVDPVREMTVARIIELFAEAIPGVLIQLMAVATSKKVGIFSWVSLGFSAFTTGFVSATLSYDWDTDPRNRAMQPKFYGFIPAQAAKRVIVFGSMMTISAGMLMIRAMTIVLLGLVGWNWAFAYIGLDLSLYLVVKTLKGDFWYWAPLGGYVEVVVSLFFRVIVKVINDFMSLMQLRHPQEVGGAYWAFSALLTIASLPVAIMIYMNNGGDAKTLSFAWTVFWILLPTVSFCTLIFVLTVEKTHVNTFFSTETGKVSNQSRFKNAKDDATKALVFRWTKHYWVGIEDDMRLWVQQNWSRWKEEKPKWLDEITRSRIPVEWIPNTKDRQRESVRRMSIRRRSIVEAIAGTSG